MQSHRTAHTRERGSDEEADGHGGVLYKCGRASCQAHWRRDGAIEELYSHANVDVGPAEISMHRDRTWRKPHSLLLTPCMPLHGGEAATVTPSGDEKRLLPAETALACSGCAR